MLKIIQNTIKSKIVKIRINDLKKWIFLNSTMASEFLELMTDVDIQQKIDITEAICEHTEIVEDMNGVKYCVNCGQEASNIDTKAEWRQYGNNTNNSRCHKNKKVRSTDDVLKKMDLPEAISQRVDDKYIAIVTFMAKQNGKDDGSKLTLRGNNRKAIIAGCLFYTYIEMGQMRTSDYIRSLFDLTQKSMSYGLNAYTLVFPDSRTKIIKPIHLLKWFLNITGISMEHYKKLASIISALEESSIAIKRSTPQAFAAAVIYTFFAKEGLDIKREDFAGKIGISKITLDSMIKEVEKHNF